jgi:hypothetical protein
MVSVCEGFKMPHACDHRFDKSPANLAGSMWQVPRLIVPE